VNKLDLKKNKSIGNVYVVTITSIIIYLMLIMLIIADISNSISSLAVLFIAISLCCFIFGILISIIPQKFYKFIYKISRRSLEEGYYQIDAMKFENNRFYLEANVVLLNISYIFLILILLI
jgi:hypothetical protein